MTAPNHLHLLAWDSAFLGFGVGRLAAQQLSGGELGQQLAEARAAGLRLLYLVAPAADAPSNASARAAGAWLAARQVTYAVRVEPAEAQRSVAAGICSTTALAPPLVQLAQQSGEFSRFRLDGRMPPGAFAGLYREWLRKSLTGELAREVLVHGTAAEPRGLLTLAAADAEASIGLLAVADHARGQGLGRQLVAAARQRTAAWGLAELHVVTQQANSRACRFYEQCGFGARRVEHVYHLWL